jgi:hypothetical protein
VNTRKEHCGLPCTKLYLISRKLVGWPKRSKLAQAFRWEYNYKRLKLAQLLGQLGIILSRLQMGGARVGLGRIVALHHGPSTLYWNS